MIFPPGFWLIFSFLSYFVNSYSDDNPSPNNFYSRVRKLLPVIRSFRTVNPKGKQIHEVKLERTLTETGKIATMLTLSRKSKSELFPKDAESVTIIANPETYEIPSNSVISSSFDGISTGELERMYILLGLKNFYTLSSSPNDLVRLYNRLKPGKPLWFAMLLQCIPSILNRWENRLTLRNKGLTDRDVEILSGILPNLVDVKYLDLSGNRIGDSGSIALAAVLKNSQIEYLDLSKNQIKEDGMDAIANSIIYSSVSTIKIRDNLAKKFTIPLPVDLIR